MKRKALFTSILALMMSFSIMTAQAKETEYIYSVDTAQTDWTLSGVTDYISFADNGIIATNYKSFSAIYENEIFESVEYNITLNNKASKTGNALIVYFNYQDTANNYYFLIGGAKTDNPVKLYKTVEGEKILLDEYAHYNINYSARKFKVVCEGGNIQISVSDSNGITELFNVNDDTFKNGKIGIGGNNASGEFTKISAKGKVNSYMKIVALTPEADATEVEVDTAAVISFDKELDGETVNNKSIYVLEDENGISEDLYSVTADYDTVTVELKQMNEGTKYTIVVTTDVKSIEDEALASEYRYSFHTTRGEDYGEYLYNYENVSEWVCTSPEKLTASETSLASNAWDAKFNAILNSYIFRDEFKYSLNYANSGGANSNSVQIYFNYTDADNNYYINVAGTKDGEYPMKLFKTQGGVKSDLGEATVKNNVPLRIEYKNGRIRVYVSDELKIEAEDTTFTSGRIGIGVQATVGTFKNIKAEGYRDNVQLNFTDESNTFNSQTGVELDHVVELVFNYPLKSGEVKKGNIYVTKEDTQMADGDYDISLSEEKTKIIITFKEKLEEKTYYSIVFTEDIVSSEYGVSLLSKDRTITFLTKPPVYDLQSAQMKYFDPTSGEYTDVTDISQMGGKDVKVNISIKNNGDSSQTFAVSAMLVQPDGKIVGTRYYFDELNAGEEFNKTDSDSDNVIFVPSDIAEGSKLVYYVWDSFTNMISLYPSGEF